MSYEHQLAVIERHWPEYLRMWAFRLKTWAWFKNMRVQEFR